ncbi:MAG TPA: YbaN family protein [Paracoccaceae bacterium]|nr:YbaN family protein [Paracoccaceae bacterium]
MRYLWLILGAASLVLGAIGAVLPLLPTVPFLILAAFAFARSSDRLHDWLVNHRSFGAPIRDWRATGSIRRPFKWFATGSVAAVLAISLLVGAGWPLLALQAAALAASLLFVWTRPEQPAPAPDQPGRDRS